MCSAFNWLERIILPALSMFYSSRDSVLIKRGVAEECIVAHIFCCMKWLLESYEKSEEIPQYLSIDNEYDKNDDGRKFIYQEKCIACGKADCMAFQHFIVDAYSEWMEPDIIIHGRKCNDKNMVVVEFKKKANRGVNKRKADFAKLTYFTCQKLFPSNFEIGEDKNYKYTHGYFIDLDTDSCDIITYENGEQIDCETYKFSLNRIERSPCKKQVATRHP